MEQSKKRETRSQFAALCYRKVEGKLRFLLVTSRRTKRWIIPKGWPETGMTPAEAAGLEAMEEAGVKGKMSDRCVGVFSYAKHVTDDIDLPCVVMVYPMRVKKLLRDYPEKSERRRKWFSRKQAAAKVDEPELKKLIKTFDPNALK